eukprot:353888-Chlamydomonas_euryale.AAC.3
MGVLRERSSQRCRALRACCRAARCTTCPIGWRCPCRGFPAYSQSAPELQAEDLQTTAGWLFDPLSRRGRHCARSWATPYQSNPANRNERTGLRAATAPSCHVERGLVDRSTKFCQPFSKQQPLNHRPTSRPGHVSGARAPRRLFSLGSADFYWPAIPSPVYFQPGPGHSCPSAPYQPVI